MSMLTASSLQTRPVASLPTSRVSAAFRPISTRSNAGVTRTADACAARPTTQRFQSIVTFAKGKGGKRGGNAATVESSSPKGKGGKGGKADSPAGDVDVAKIEKEAKADSEDRMKKAMLAVGDNFNSIRTGRANPAILDRVFVDYFGTPSPLKNVAAISVADSSTLVITPFDKTALKDIERAINESDLGINPSNDGERIRLGLPQLTQDRRKELAKQVAKMGEEGKVAVRNVRKDVMKKIDKYGDAFSKDAKKSLENDIQKLTDTYCKKVDDMVKAKSDEVMKV